MQSRLIAYLGDRTRVLAAISHDLKTPITRRGPRGDAVDARRGARLPARRGARARIIVDDDERRLRIRVLDEGPGIPAAEMDKVFEPFYRAENSRNRTTGGTGPGLSIAKDHGGSLKLSNRAEGGLEATLVLPRTGVRRA